MGTGIAQVAATAGHPVYVCDSSQRALDAAGAGLKKVFARLVDKGRIKRTFADDVLGRIEFSSDVTVLADAGLVIEAIVEDLTIKKQVFAAIEDNASRGDAVFATNTSSLSVTAIAAACSDPSRVIGLHFFNPAPLMPLVEVVPGIATAPAVCDVAATLVGGLWQKITVIAKDTPGFIVNRVARPFYGEALRILEEGIADAPTIDWAMREIGGFRMGPFELMDLIGNDVNLKVTETVFEAFFFDPRFRPSFTQQRMVEAGRLGRKTGLGYYDYRDDAPKQEPTTAPELGRAIVDRILAMLINEAADAVFMQVATAEDVDLAMTKGVNYPKGLLQWADELGIEAVLRRLESLQAEYAEDRYRPNPLIRRLARTGGSFYARGSAKP
jgi:3-hydroxybutyryl-CoA dehydrogenase